jgi:hypothetical protein
MRKSASKHSPRRAPNLRSAPLSFPRPREILTRREMEQAQLLLEAAHLPRQRRLGPVQPAGRKGHASVLGDRHEVPHMPEFHGSTLCREGMGHIPSLLDVIERAMRQFVTTGIDHVEAAVGRSHENASHFRDLLTFAGSTDGGSHA